MTVHVNFSLAQTERGDDSRLSEGGLGEKEGTWWDSEEQLALIRNQESLSFCKIRDNSTPSLLFTRPYYK